MVKIDLDLKEEVILTVAEVADIKGISLAEAFEYVLEKYSKKALNDVKKIERLVEKIKG